MITFFQLLRNVVRNDQFIQRVDEELDRARIDALDETDDVRDLEGVDAEAPLQRVVLEGGLLQTDLRQHARRQKPSIPVGLLKKLAFSKGNVRGC